MMNEETIKGPRFCKAVDGVIEGIGHVVSWLSVILIVVIIAQVVLRYVFGKGLVVLEELQWHLYAVGIIIGLSYCVVQNSHIRLDLLYDRFPQRRKEKIEIFGMVFLLLPIIIIILIHSWDFVYESWKVSERSDAPMGLPCRWFIKSFLTIGFGLLGVSVLSRIVRAFAFLKKA